MTTIFKNILVWIFFIAVLSSCGKDYTIEDKVVTGNFTYVTKEFKPTAFDPATQAPLAASITMEGSGTVSDMGTINILSSFKYDFISGKGTDFTTTYTGASAADTFKSNGTSQRQSDGSILVTETLSNGTGKFSKIKGGGESIVIIRPDNTGGTGVIKWTVTY